MQDFKFDRCKIHLKFIQPRAKLSSPPCARRKLTKKIPFSLYFNLREPLEARRILSFRRTFPRENKTVVFTRPGSTAGLILFPEHRERERRFAVAGGWLIWRQSGREISRRERRA